MLPQVYRTSTERVKTNSGWYHDTCHREIHCSAATHQRLWSTGLKCDREGGMQVFPYCEQEIN